MKLDVKTELHYRQAAMNMALATHEAQPTRTAVETLATAEKYFQFLAANTMSADAVLTDFRDVSTIDLQELRRTKLLELDGISNALRTRGVVPT